MTAVVNNGEVAVLLEWRQLPPDLTAGGEVAFNIFRGVPVAPAPAGPGENAWSDGEGVFRVTPDSFDERGPRVRFEDIDLTPGGLLTGGHQFLDLLIPIPELDLELTLTVHQAQIEMRLDVVDGGDAPYLETVPQMVSGSAGPVEVGGGRLGGFVRADDIMGFFNEGAERCGCAAPVADPGPLIEHGQRPAPVLAYEAACNWTPLQPGHSAYTCTPDDSALCPNLLDICQLLPFFPILLDVDSNKNNIRESISVGLFFDLTRARLDPNPIAAPGE